LAPTEGRVAKPKWRWGCCRAAVPYKALQSQRQETQSLDNNNIMIITVINVNTLVIMPVNGDSTHNSFLLYMLHNVFQLLFLFLFFIMCSKCL